MTFLLAPCNDLTAFSNHSMPPVMVPTKEQDPQDLVFMDLAVEMAEEALSCLEIPVGCVLVRDSRVIATGRNKTNEMRNATLHAEFDAMAKLLPPRSPSSDPAAISPEDAPSFADTTLYVTVEPCLMCASALRQARIGRVVFGCANERFGGCGGVQMVHSDPALKFSPPMEAVGGYRREEAIMLLRKFYVTENAHGRIDVAPKPKNKNNRILKFDIPPLSDLQSASSSPVPSSPL